MLFTHALLSILLGTSALADSVDQSKKGDKVESSASHGCSKPFDFPAEAGGPSKGIQIGDRKVRITLPKNYKQDVPAPLILAFHDKDMTPSEMAEATQLSNSKLNPDHIIIYPEAFEGKWLSDPDANLKIDDKIFIASFVDGLSERLCIDTDRIYATGLGVGAGLVHFLACDPLFSKRISAFAITNAALYTGLKDNRKDVKDLVSIQWEKCKPSRIPTRILAIHSENNTVNDYFGRPGGTRKRMPVVQWLVEWAMRNECGGAEGQPEKEHEDDMLYLTPLEGGTIHEGAVHMNKLQQAYYKCYETTEEEMVEKFLEAFKDIDLGLKNTTTENETTTEKIESNTTEEGEDKEEKVEQSDIDSTEESTPDNLDVGSAEKKESDIKNDQIDTEKAVENAGEGGNPEWKKPKKERGIVCLMHYFIKNNGHGWPRVLMKNGSTEQIGSEEVQPTDETPIFDSTVTILDWFKQHKLSDEGRLPAAERMGKQAVNPEGLEAVLNQLGENQDGESTAEHGQESSPENKEAKEGGEKQEKIDRVKDEL